MNRREQVTYCGACKHKKQDIRQGLICGLTNDIPILETECEKRDIDLVEKKEIESKRKIAEEIINKQETSDNQWKIIGSVLFFIVMIGFKVVKYNNYNTRSTPPPSQEIDLGSFMKKRAYQDQLQQLSTEEKKDLGVTTTTKSQKRNIDDFLSINIPSGIYLFKNLENETLTFMGRTKRNDQITLYKLKKKVGKEVAELWQEARTNEISKQFKYNIVSVDEQNFNYTIDLISSIKTTGTSRIFESQDFYYVFSVEASMKELYEVKNISKNWFNRIELLK
ncbi:MAG: hypothetical protein ACPG6V_08785 [Flavobacteriales bacterium]